MFIYQFCIQRFNTLSGIFPSPPRSRGALFQILLESRQNFTGSLLVIKKKKWQHSSLSCPEQWPFWSFLGRRRTGPSLPHSWIRLAYGSPPQCRSNSRIGFVLFSVMARKIGALPGRTRKRSRVG